MRSILKYPRTPHLEGSRFQPGDEDLASVPLSELSGTHVVIEEKLDGANAGVSFDEAGELLLQSRGHYLTGGARERHFALFKTWASAHRPALHDVLGSRYVMYGEWLYAKHTVFYDALPHYFLEFDVLDKATGEFLSTPERRKLLQGAPVTSAPILHEGVMPTAGALRGLVQKASFKTDSWLERLAASADESGTPVERALRETDPSDQAEGLYIKAEERGQVLDRYKYVRGSFLTTVLEAGGHWLNRPILPNGLAPDVDIFTQTR